MEEVQLTDPVFLLQHPLANPKDPPVAVPTLPRHRQQPSFSFSSPSSTTQVPPTPTSLPNSFSPPASPVLTSKTSHSNNNYSHNHRQRQHQHQHHSHCRNPSTGSGSSAGTMGAATGVSSRALRTHPTQLSLARDLTTRLWQREAELQTMKELYDAKIRRLTEMLQDAGVSPTEVENNLAVVAEVTDDKLPLFDQLSVMGDSPAAAVRVEGTTQEERAIGEGSMSEVFGEECSSIVLDRDDEEEVEDDDLLFMSSSGSLSLLSSYIQGYVPNRRSHDTSRHKNNNNNNNTICIKNNANVSNNNNTSDNDPSYTNKASCQQQVPEYPDQLGIRPSAAMPYASVGEVKAYTGRQGSGHGHESLLEEQEAVIGAGQGHDPQRPIPSFIAESFAAGTLGIKTLREKWAHASGVLSWSKPKSMSDQFTTSSSSCSGSIVTSPSGLFIRSDGIVNDKKPALVEASIPPPLTDELSPLSDRRDREKDKNRERDIWNSIVSPTTGRKLSKNHPSHTRPMSDLGFMGPLTQYPAMTMARDIPRPPINRIHDYLQRPDSYNPSPLHYRAISMAANLIDTGAITPAKLYARRTQSMIAKWTLGLIMNSKQTRSTQSSFPVVRESLSSEQEELLLGDHEYLEGGERSSTDHGERNGGNLEMMASSYDRTDSLDITELPKVLSFRSHSATPSLLASSYPHSSSLHYYMQHSMSTHQSVLELSDISSSPRPMSPSSLSGLAGGESNHSGHGSKPLTDRYGFLVQARPMALQQGMMKFNDTYAADDLDSPSLARTMGAAAGHNKQAGNHHSPEYMPGSAEESERSMSPMPNTSLFYFGHLQGNAGSSGTGASTTTATTTMPTSVTSPVLSTATRPMSTLSPPTSSSATITTLLSQIKVLHDTVQMTQNEKWDAFLRKRRRRVHLGETNGGALANMSSTNLNLTSPLFGNLMMSSIEDQLAEQDDDQSIYWTSVCIIGIATMGKGSDWEEFRDLARGGIPVVYRNKIWQEASGAYDMRQPGYYKGLLSRQDLEACQCWGDIELDLHRTFPTNILFGPGGHGIDKLKNILIAYSLHNPTVGYCQGMNLLAGTLLLTNNSEEEAFWILTAMLGRHLPEDYFTQQLLSPQADQRVLRELVQDIMPRLSVHFQEMHVDLTAVTFSWFLTLFTDCLPVETLLRVWDVFFVEGMMVVFKIAVAILWMNEKEILKCRNGAAVYCFMKQMTLGMHQADKLMKVAFVTLKSYIHPEKIEAKRLFHQRSVREEMIQEQQQRKMRTFACASPPQRPISPPVVK
ncbi:hypothetical protein BGZ70_007208 [Mortierella alpina]|uniref:Rab-GAP TBC domain-containing protein n=1 Tax=Mortierella alpina TaxID=64518 RepID=A0A9P6JDQ7_MORAP|nr:hypothetical protein BGZ70_007208 [Mortierella alpina]